MRLIIFGISLVFTVGVFVGSSAWALEGLRVAQAQVTTTSTMEKKAVDKKAEAKEADSKQDTKKADAKSAEQEEAKEESPQPMVTLKKVSPWSVMLYGWTEAGLKGSTPYTDWALRLKYKLNDKWTLALTADLQTQWEDSLNFDFLDPHVMMSSGDLGMLPWGLKTSGYGRVYLPLSTASRESEHITMIRIGYTVTKPLGKLSLSYYAEPRFYFHGKSYTVGTDEVTGLQKPDVLENRDGSRAIRYRHWLKGEYRLSDTVSIYSLLGLWHNWNNNPSADVEGNGKYDSVVNAITETAVTYTGIKGLYIAGGITQLGPSLEDNGFAYLRENEGGTHPAAFVETVYNFSF